MYPALNKVLVIDPSGELRDFLRFCAGRLWPKLEIVSYLWARGCPDDTFDWKGFDIVVLERRLHERDSSGIAWLRALKRNPALPPVLLVAGDLTENVRREGEAVGAAAVLDKDDLSPRFFARCVADALSPPPDKSTSAKDATPAEESAAAGEPSEPAAQASDSSESSGASMSREESASHEESVSHEASMLENEALPTDEPVAEEIAAAEGSADGETLISEEALLSGDVSVAEQAPLAEAEEPADLDATATHPALLSQQSTPPHVDGFTIIRPIATTTRGWVSVATDESTHRAVALKTISIPYDVDLDVLKGFSQEYASLGYLRHNHVIRIFKHGFTRSCAFIATEYCEGGDLRQRIEHGIPVWDAVDYLSQIMHGLNAVHARGILHRNIKPSNLLLREDGTLVLTDFGIEKELSGNPRFTAISSDDVNYLSPEFIRYGAVDVRSDLYSAGLILYEMLTGATRHADSTPAAAIEAHLRAPIPGLPPESAVLQPLIDGLLAKDPNERFQSAEDVLDGIEWLSRAHGARHLGSKTAAAGYA